MDITDYSEGLVKMEEETSQDDVPIITLIPSTHNESNQVKIEDKHRFFKCLSITLFPKMFQRPRLYAVFMFLWVLSMFWPGQIVLAMPN